MSDQTIAVVSVPAVTEYISVLDSLIQCWLNKLFGPLVILLVMGQTYEIA
jgi:hypothetical protein